MFVFGEKCSFKFSVFNIENPISLNIWPVFFVVYLYALKISKLNLNINCVSVHVYQFQFDVELKKHTEKHHLKCWMIRIKNTYTLINPMKYNSLAIRSFVYIYHHYIEFILHGCI